MRCRAAPFRQDGFVLAMALMFLALMIATAAVGPAAAGLELLRAGAIDARSRADAAATSGLHTALRQGEIETTSPGIVATEVSPSARSTVRSVFLGFRHGSPEQTAAGLVQWHFLLTATGTSGRDTRATQAMQVSILAPEPADRETCIESGCPVPPVCPDATPCGTTLRSPPVPVAWHLPADPS